MATIKTVDTGNKAAGEIEIDDSILETPYHRKAVSEVVRQFLAANQQGTHSTKNRSEVAYSTRKLYRQKGTGSSRAGSAKSPIRRHGGTIFGPQMRSHAFRLNKKTRRLATRSVFAEKVRQDGVLVLDSLTLTDSKTRNLKALLTKLELPAKVLIVADEVSDNLRLASRNLPDVHVLSYRSLNVYEMMRYTKVIFVKDALEAYKERLGR
ncbi:MAG TPA: 50S ribosomal protein L4 [Deltaproteobacteria bacterium]|nr:50S ribosomal protein L4 [Deltaproteobacteria bacterium]HHZ77833.1 50S ribosomal protein L4 [Candidatus Lambdaproteobacteria bacterium]HIB93045.1 50S ribosomal protein L4 [Candidatus Lambdaproteobacteria bacterium]HIN47717.1 50S ribosomal protein L4 [Deltaproteobacteria bacterium]HIO60986.1 50S ribosomal protein L4 [Deltaproteobacteria bacterium]